MICHRCQFSIDGEESVVDGNYFCRDCSPEIPQQVVEQSTAPQQPIYSVPLRPYQEQAIKGIFECFNEHDSTLVVMATGLGKTVTLAGLIERWQEGRILVMAHRDELIQQAVDKITRFTGIECDVEMGDRYSDQCAMYQRAPVVVTSVQTMSRTRRMERFVPEDFGLLFIDEAHHAPSPSYLAVIEYFRRNPRLKVGGLSATPDRLDERAMGRVFASVACDYGIMDGIDDGYLVGVDQQFVPVHGLDLSSVKTTAGDLNLGQLSSLVENKEAEAGQADAIYQETREKKTLVFTPSVQSAEDISNLLNAKDHGSSEWICGDKIKCPTDRRRDILKAYARGDFQRLVNCLDEQTEILTSDGWIGREFISHDHEVANWQDGVIYFEKPLAIIHRERRDDERMVSLETDRMSIRVTEDHRMLYRTWDIGKYKHTTAGELAWRFAKLPINGNARPVEILAEQPVHRNDARRVQANSYNIRRSAGISFDESVAIAKSRIAEASKLRHTQPKELTNEDCQLIGFFLGDGCKAKLQNGGIEYTFSQSCKCPSIRRWFLRLCMECGFNVVEKTKQSNDGGWHWVWSLCRGTGFGPQKREGVFRIEPYLNKDGSGLFTGLNREQFHALIFGLHMADGTHLDCTEHQSRYAISGVNQSLFDLLQAIAVCRGFMASIAVSKIRKIPAMLRGQAVRATKPLLTLYISTRGEYHMTHKNCLTIEPGWKAEQVWCVTTSSGNIVTRRRGFVTVMGQCSVLLEGFDDPGIQCIAVCRPTKSRSLYAQMLGRGLRPLTGLIDGLETSELRKAAIASSTKKKLTVLEFIGNNGNHKLIHSGDILGGNYEEEVIAAATVSVQAKTAKGERNDMLAELRAAEERLAHERSRKLADVSVKAKYSKHHLDPFAVWDILPKREPGYLANKRPTEKQMDFMKRLGMKEAEIKNLSLCAAKQILDKAMERRKAGLCTYPQSRTLARNGFSPDLSFEEASATITRMAESGWKLRGDHQQGT